MKNSELQDLKPVYIHEVSNSDADEISLVDLIIMLIRRKKMLIAIMCMVTTVGAGMALLVPKMYTFSTSIEIGGQVIDGTNRPFESPQTLLAKLQYSFIPQILYKQQLANPNDRRYTISPREPRSSGIIVLEVKGTEDQADLLIDLLRQVTEKTIQDHKRIYEAVKENLTLLKTQAEGGIASLNSKKDRPTEEIRLLEYRIDTYNSKIANLRNTREVSSPIRSVDPAGNRKSLIIIAFFVGVFVAVFAVFFAEFISRIKEARLQSSVDNQERN